MKSARSLAALAGLALVFSLSSTGASAALPPQASDAVPVCPGPAAAGSARCHAQVVPGVGKAATAGPTGLRPADIVAAYGWSGIGTGAGKTIAIVDAYDDPTAKADLDTFSTQFGLPVLPTCAGTLGASSPTPCFQKVNQRGGSKMPRADQGWALEISLDVQWAHAVAPGASILLVEASSNRFSDLLAAEDYAAAHASYVSNSWGGSEFSGESGYDAHFQRAGVSFFVSSGDAGTPAEYPSASPYVISVGGTTLDLSGGVWSETGWTKSGGGCSAYEAANAAQATGSVSCSGMRATPDVALDANPNSGVSVVDTYGYQGQKGWFVVGGTSASSPMWAARSATAGVVVDAAYVYGAHATPYRDITSATSATTASGCNSAGCGPGYDLTTGLGTWVGTGQ